MNKFARVSEFEMLSENDSRRLYGGFDDEELPSDDGTTQKTISCTVVTSTSGCTCNNNTPDSCMDTGQGSECVKD